MRSSQKSESINSYFACYVNLITPLNEFIGQYNKAIEAQRRNEERKDTLCMRSIPKVCGMHKLEAHGGRGFTKNLFKIF